jgi:hypothetical protein
MSLNTTHCRREEVTRRDWWLGVLLVVGALLVHALVPRYSYLPTSHRFMFIQVDRWGGQAVAGVVGAKGNAGWTPLVLTPGSDPLTVGNK